MDLTLVLGGARSGKSTFAETLLTAGPSPWIYIATAEAHDDEMRERIAQHRARRAAGWTTIDAPINLADALLRNATQPALVDCLTLWLSNLLISEADIDTATVALRSALTARSAPTVLVSNEVGLGIVPDNALARRFRDAAGRLHQQLAREANRVVFMVAGLPITVK